MAAEQELLAARVGLKNICGECNALSVAKNGAA